MPDDVITFSISNGGKLKITSAVFDRINEYRQDDPKSTEAGGVLLGRFIIDSTNIVIDEITIPMPGDKRKRFSYIRKAKLHQEVIDREWVKSNGTCNYLGEWHTHPESFPTYSQVDITSWKQRLNRDQYSSRFLYFLILGIKEICVWEGDRKTLKFKKLNQI